MSLTQRHSVSLLHCNDHTAAAMRGWMRVMPDFSSNQWFESADDQQVDIIICDPSHIALANLDSVRKRAVLAVWGWNKAANATLPNLPMPVTAQSFSEFVREVEMQLVTLKLGGWWQRNQTTAKMQDLSAYLTSSNRDVV
jgi:hypothetical protein